MRRPGCVELGGLLPCVRQQDEPFHTRNNETN